MTRSFNPTPQDGQRGSTSDYEGTTAVLPEPAEDAVVDVVVEEGEAIFLLFGDLELANPEDEAHEAETTGRHTIPLEVLQSGAALEESLQFEAIREEPRPKPPNPMGVVPDLDELSTAPTFEGGFDVLDDERPTIEPIEDDQPLTAREEAEQLLERDHPSGSGPLQQEDLENHVEERTESTEGTLWWWPVVQARRDEDEAADPGGMHVIRGPKTLPTESIVPIPTETEDVQAIAPAAPPREISANPFRLALGIAALAGAITVILLVLQ